MPKLLRDVILVIIMRQGHRIKNGLKIIKIDLGELKKEELLLSGTFMNNKINVLATSGGTKVKIDDARHIANMSSGTFGAKIATEFLKIPQVNLTFLKAEGSKSPFTLDVD